MAKRSLAVQLSRSLLCLFLGDCESLITTGVAMSFCNVLYFFWSSF